MWIPGRVAESVQQLGRAIEVEKEQRLRNDVKRKRLAEKMKKKTAKRQRTIRKIAMHGFEEAIKEGRVSAEKEREFTESMHTWLQRLTAPQRK
jgi:flagellar biosynthesis/type III secretory pathway protein FliH